MTELVDYEPIPKSGAGPLVPRAPLLALIQRRYPGRSIGDLFEAVGICRDHAYARGKDNRRWYSFATADKIVTCVLDDPGLWTRVDFLRQAYEQLPPSGA